MESLIFSQVYNTKCISLSFKKKSVFIWHILTIRHLFYCFYFFEIDLVILGFHELFGGFVLLAINRSSREKSSSNRIRKTSPLPTSETCPLMYSVSIAKIVERIGQKKLVGELRGRSEGLRNVCEDEHDEDPGRYEESGDEGHGIETDMGFELDGEHNEDDGYEQIPAESECSSESVLVGNEEIIPPKSQAVNAAEVKDRNHDVWQKNYRGRKPGYGFTSCSRDNPRQQ